MKLKISLTPFYSQGDERRFFQGLKDNRGIVGILGIGRQLEINLDLRRIDRESLVDLIALFRRYSVPLEPLSVLGSKARFEWLNDKDWKWHSNMFPKAK